WGIAPDSRHGQPPYGRLETHRESKETAMNPVGHIRRIAAVLAGLAAALMALGVTPAFAKVQPEPGGAGAAPVPSAQPSVQVHTVVAGAMPAWRVIRIAV